MWMVVDIFMGGKKFTRRCWGWYTSQMSGPIQGNLAQRRVGLYSRDNFPSTAKESYRDNNTTWALYNLQSISIALSPYILTTLRSMFIWPPLSDEAQNQMFAARVVSESRPSISESRPFPWCSIDATEGGAISVSYHRHTPCIAFCLSVVRHRSVKRFP